MTREVTGIRNYDGQGSSLKHRKKQAAESDAGINSLQRNSTKQHKAVRSNGTSLMSSNQCVATDKTITRHGLVTRHDLMSRMRSLIGRNTFFCQARYGQVIDEIMCGACSSRCIKRNYYLETMNILTL